MHYVDVHTHLTHRQFAADCEEVIARAVSAGLGAIVVNGLEPQSNRIILDLAAHHPQIKAALGIYPIDAVADLLPADFPHPTPVFDIDAEITFIRDAAKDGKLKAIGECGLDGHWLTPDTFVAQERVFLKLVEVAVDHDLPVIIHTRKLEQRAADLLAHHGVRKVNFHCFGGKTSLAQKCAEQHGWWFSIPANARRSESFTKMLRTLPINKILTETDAPYLSPVPKTRNEPANVVGTVDYLAELRQLTREEAKRQVWTNYLDLFGQ